MVGKIMKKEMCCCWAVFCLCVLCCVWYVVCWGVVFRMLCAVCCSVVVLCVSIMQLYGGAIMFVAIVVYYVVVYKYRYAVVVYCRRWSCCAPAFMVCLMVVRAKSASNVLSKIWK